MKLPRDLSGADLVQALCKHYGYRRLHQEGSHIILETNTPSQHRISIPNHNPLRVGTLSAILRAVSRRERCGEGRDTATALSFLPMKFAQPARTTVQSVLWDQFKVETDCVAMRM